MHQECASIISAQHGVRCAATTFAVFIWGYVRGAEKEFMRPKSTRSRRSRRRERRKRRKEEEGGGDSEHLLCSRRCVEQHPIKVSRPYSDVVAWKAPRSFVHA
jgi:hypothetical protein